MGSSPVAPTIRLRRRCHRGHSSLWVPRTSSFSVVRKLCERPGCGALADVSYGIDNSTLTVWVDNRAILEREQAGRLCRRHADALVVPRGWTIDDRRQPVPQLFRVVDTEAPPARPRAARQAKPQKAADPSLFESIEAELKARENASPVAEPISTEPHPPADIGEAPESTTGQIDPDETKAIPWSPRLVAARDEADDEDAPVLGRLMGRAFGKKNNP